MEICGCVRRIVWLRSDLPVRLRVGGSGAAPGASGTGTRDQQLPEHRLAEEREAALAALAVRTTALPLGRGMLGYGLVQSRHQQAQLQLPRLCLAGRADPHGVTVELGRADHPTQLRLWPDFHNGAATGLSLSRYASVDNSFIWQVGNIECLGYFSCPVVTLLLSLCD